MTSAELAERERQLTDALRVFDWNQAEELGRDLAAAVLRDPASIPETAARRILSKLRRKGRFPLMACLAEALIQSGQRAPQIRRQYAQALIDQGSLTAAELVLQSILQDSQGSRGEEIEARGLVGRIYKQLYINANGAGGPYPATRPFLERAINEYLYAYRLSPEDNYWHGINVVALLHRASLDGVSLQGLPYAADLAREILATLECKAATAVAEVPAFEIATALEAWVAIATAENSAAEQCERAIHEAGGKALEYTAAGDADAFEVASTLRQLTEVWRLSEQTPPGSRVLPVLRAALLSREGSTVNLTAQEVRSDLEKVFGADKFQAVSWYKTGLERCGAVARIERRSGMGYGTGWLVRAQDFFPGDNSLLLITNTHVISPTPYPHALLPSQARANFQMLGKKIDIEDEDVVWSSPVGKFDATMIRLKGDFTQAVPLPLSSAKVQLADPPPRLYIIGHPGGGDLAFSLQDNYLIACSDRLLHYRTPTEGGSSGSPVFEPEDWRVVALHHAGKAEMERLDGQSGTYEANEGIVIQAIQQAVHD